MNNWPELMDWDPWDPLENARLDLVCINGVALQPGDRVRLHPKPRTDAFDRILAGRTATIESIEQDYEDHVYVAVLVDDDPGKDKGARHKLAQRFFCAAEEVEPMKKPAQGEEKKEAA